MASQLLPWFLVYLPLHPKLPLSVELTSQSKSQSNTMPSPRKSSKRGFKTGHKYHQGRHPEELNTPEHSADDYASSQYRPRLTRDTFNAVVRQRSDGVLYGPTEENQVGPVKYLRPKPEPEKKVEYSKDKNLFVSKDMLLAMMNTVFKEHLNCSPACCDPSFYVVKEIKKGVTFRWILGCVTCGYKSCDQFKLYQEVKKDGPGAKAAQVNVALAVGSQQIGSQAKARMLLTSASVVPMCKSSLQKSINSVSDKTVNLNTQDMLKIQDSLKGIIAERGAPEASGCNAQMDSVYNSFTFGRRTRPGQAATQAVTMICEDETPKHSVIGVAIKTKLCYKGAWLLGRGFDPKCGSSEAHDGCKANIPDYKALKEYDMGKMIGMDLAANHMMVHCCTTDGDGKSAQGLEDAFSTFYKRFVKVERLSDSVHKGQCQFKHGMKAAFSADMFCGDKSESKKVFCSDVAIRAEAIFSRLYDRCLGDVEAMGEKLATIVDNVISCYDGDCINCCIDSTLCNGGDKSWWTKSAKLFDYGLKASDISMTIKDRLLLRGILEMKLSKTCLQKLRLRTTTQSVESYNRRINLAAPKNITHLSNFPGKVHSVVHTINRGHHDSVHQKLDTMGVSLSKESSDVLKTMDKNSEYHKQWKGLSETKARKATVNSIRTRQFYKAKREGKGTVDCDYRKHQLDEVIGPARSLQNEHNYIVKPATSGHDHRYAHDRLRELEDQRDGLADEEGRVTPRTRCVTAR